MIILKILGLSELEDIFFRSIVKNVRKIFHLLDFVELLNNNRRNFVGLSNNNTISGGIASVNRESTRLREVEEEFNVVISLVRINTNINTLCVFEVVNGNRSFRNFSKN